MPRSHAASAPRFRPRADRTYIAFNKPFEVLTQFTLSDQSNKRTLAEFGFPAVVYPVGRLDYDSEGLLLLTDDNALNDALLNPERSHPRTYLVQVEKIPDAEALKQLRSGVVIQGRRTLPAHAELLATDPDLPPRPVPIRYRREIPTAWIRVTLTEGRNRQVRRMTAAVGHPTLRLVRVAIGGLDLFSLGLAPGEWRILSHDEVLQALQHNR
jgi:23S rRNA pseudouridine2457 synthase